jgi:hypothetical protein
MVVRLGFRLGFRFGFRLGFRFGFVRLFVVFRPNVVCCGVVLFVFLKNNDLLSSKALHCSDVTGRKTYLRGFFFNNQLCLLFLSTILTYPSRLRFTLSFLTHPFFVNVIARNCFRGQRLSLHLVSGR